MSNLYGQQLLDKHSAGKKYIILIFYIVYYFYRLYKNQVFSLNLELL